MLADLDVVPNGNGRNGDGVIDLDTSHILCEGTSMGSFNGTLFAEFVPEVEGCFQQVGGAGIMDTLAHSRLWFLFDNVVPTGGWVAAPVVAKVVTSMAAILGLPSDNYVEAQDISLPLQQYIKPEHPEKKLASNEQ